MTQQNGVWVKLKTIWVIGIGGPAIICGLLLLSVGMVKLLSAVTTRMGVNLGEFIIPIAVTFTLSGIASIWVILESLISKVNTKDSAWGVILTKLTQIYSSNHKKNMKKKLLGVSLVLIGIFGILTPLTPFGIPALLAGLTMLGWKHVAKPKS